MFRRSCYLAALTTAAAAVGRRRRRSMIGKSARDFGREGSAAIDEVLGGCVAGWPARPPVGRSSDRPGVGRIVAAPADAAL